MEAAFVASSTCGAWKDNLVRLCNTSPDSNSACYMKMERLSNVKEEENEKF